MTEVIYSIPFRLNTDGGRDFANACDRISAALTAAAAGLINPDRADPGAIGFRPATAFLQPLSRDEIDSLLRRLTGEHGHRTPQECKPEEWSEADRTLYWKLRQMASVEGGAE